MRNRWFACVGVFAALVVGVSDGRCGEAPVSGSEAYARWLDGAIDVVARQMPSITASADAAAEAFVKHAEYGIGTIGESGFVSEAVGRAGGIIRINYPRQVREAPWRGVVLVGLRDATLAADLESAAEKKEQGCFIVLIGRKAMEAEARKAKVSFDAFIETGAAEHDGLIAGKDGRWLIPTAPAANIAVMWTWTGEFVAACTRRGKMPPMYLAYSCEGGKEWREKIGMVKFHGPEYTPKPVKAGALGPQYLKALRADLGAIRRQEMADVRKIAGQAVEARRAGKGVYAFTHGHAIGHRLGGPHDPGYFTQINRDWTRLKRGVKLERDDLVYCVGFDRLFGGEWFRHFDQRARAKGVRLAWSISACRKGHTDSLPADEILIDQHWRWGDSAVVVPGYPHKILPTSGVLAEAALWMVTAEIHTMLNSPTPAPAVAPTSEPAHP